MALPGMRLPFHLLRSSNVIIRRNLVSSRNLTTTSISNANEGPLRILYLNASHSPTALVAEGARFAF